MSFFDELKRRNVFRVGVAYVVASWVVLQVADLVLEAISAPDWVLLAMMMVVALGFFAALIIAWAYEMTPQGIRREKDVDRSQSVTLETASKLNRITIGLVIAAVAIVAIDRLVPKKGSEPFSPSGTVLSSDENDEKRALTPPADDGNPSVAVLPFVNMSSDPEQEFFSDGISEEILNVLTRIPNLKVAARTSSFQFKGRNLDIADIARQLKVNHVLEGSVRKAGDQLRITAQLIKADTGYHLWSDTFDRKLEDVFAIQDEIAAAIATELRTRLAAEPLAASTPVRMEAYELYLKGRGLVATRREAELYEGIDILTAAIEIEPDYAPAMATLAKAYMVLPWFSRKEPAGVLREQARDWANRALGLEPKNAEALAALAIVYNEVDLNPVGALELLRAAVQASPGSVAANNFLGDLATRTGDLDSAMIYEARAAELDPLGTVQLTDLANVYSLQNRFDKVIELANRALALDPGFQNAYKHLIDAYFALGEVQKLQETIEVAEAVASLHPDVLAGMRLQLLIARGERSRAETSLGQMATKARAGKFSVVLVAFNAALLGDFDIAGEMLIKAYEEQDGTWTYPDLIRLPEQAPESEPWQEFWRLPGVAELAELRRKNGLNPRATGFGEARSDEQ